MAKKSGLAQEFYIDGFDMSGDIGSIGTMSARMSPLEVPVLNKSGMVRIGGIKDGEISFNAWFNDASEASHDAVKGLPTADSIVLAVFGGAVDDAAFGLVSKRTGYEQVRRADGSLELTITCLATGGLSLEDMVMLSPGLVTHSSAGSNSSKNDGASTADGLAAILQIVDIDSGTPTVVIEDSPNDSTWATLISFAAGGERS